MSQNRHTTPKFKSEASLIRNMSFERAFYSVILLCFTAMFAFAATTAHASVPAYSKPAKNPTYILKSNLDAMTSKDTVILDWRTQTFKLAFDLPPNDWYESLDLFLSAYPEGQVARGTPLLISYNGAKPVPIYGRASRFDAHIRMDTSRIRLSGNTIKISYQTPQNADCLTPANGQWVLDLSRSKLVAKARAKKRAMQISEIEQRLAHAMTAPKRVGITAKGANKLAFEALAAQAIAQRMNFVPEFKLGTNQRNVLSDMQFIIGTHDDIRPLLYDKSIVSAPGARISIDKTSGGKATKPKIVLTAETEEQVLELVRAFATYHLPKAQRGHMFLHEFYSGTKLSPRAIMGTGKYKLSDIDIPAISPSWRPEPARINFNVTDPHAMRGVLTLKILSAKDINPKSRLKVKLNDKSIGFTHLNKSSKMVEFRIKPGMLTASDNQISIEPEIQPSPSDSLCQTQNYIPSIMVSNESKFNLSAPRPSPATDLSRLAASGAPFDKDSILVLSAKSYRDKLATLRFLGYSAQKFGARWVQADYLASLPTRTDMDKNILIIGPNPLNDPALFSAAPSSLKHALGKSKTLRPNGEDIARTDQFASMGASQTFRTAARNNQSTRLQSGGLAALFPSPYANGRMIGVISSDRPNKFSEAMYAVAQNDYWNGLQGSVTRWDRKTILMAQTASPLPASFGLPETTPSRTPEFIRTAQNWFTSLSTRKSGKIKTPTPQAQPQQVQTVQTASNDVQIGAVRTKTPVQQLRGAIPMQPAAKKQVRQLSLPKLDKLSFKAPSMTKIKLKGYQAKRDLQAWWNQASHQAFAATPLRQWWKDITHNRAAFFGLIVFLAFFFAALASPMSARRKGR